MKREFTGKELSLNWLSRLADTGVLVCFLIAAVMIFAYPYRYAHDDALFYFQIAASVAAGDGPVFSAGLPTNGYHPFWLIICTGLWFIAPDQEIFMRLIALTTVGLSAATLLILRLGLAGTIAPLALSVGLLPSLAYVLLAGYGMESALAALCFAVTLVCAIKFLERSRAVWLIGASAAAGLCVFARLDMAVSLLPLAGYVLARSVILRDGNDMRGFVAALAVAVAIGCLPVLGWLSYNLVVFDHPVPISGQLKLAGANGFGLVPMTGTTKLLAGAMIVAVGVLAMFGRHTAHRVILAAGIGQIIYLGYLSLSGQSEVFAWYFVPMALTSSLCVAAAVDALSTRWKGKFQLPALRLSLAGAVGFLVVAGVLQTARYANRQGFDPADYRGQGSLGEVAVRNGIDRVLAFDRPGQLAYMDGLTVIAADGLTTSLAFQEHLRAESISWLIETYDIQAFVGPSEGAPWIPKLCDGTIYLGSTSYRCGDDGSFAEVEFFSRLDGSRLGSIDLRSAERIHFEPGRNLGLYVLPY